MPYTAGEAVAADDLNVTELIGACIARGKRETNSTAASAETPVLRVDSIAVKAGHIYMIKTNSFLLDTTVANDVGRCRIRLSTSGAATTASTQFANANETLDNATDGNHVNIVGLYAPGGSDQTISILLTHVRQSGTGNISIVASATAPLELFVIDLGIDPTDTGVDL